MTFFHWFVPSFLVSIFGLFSNPLTIYNYTVYGSFLRIIQFRHFLGSHQIHFLVFFLVIVSGIDCFSWNLKIEKTKSNWSKVPNWFSRIPFINDYFLCFIDFLRNSASFEKQAHLTTWHFLLVHYVKSLWHAQFWGLTNDVTHS